MRSDSLIARQCFQVCKSGDVPSWLSTKAGDSFAWPWQAFGSEQANCPISLGGATWARVLPVGDVQPVRVAPGGVFSAATFDPRQCIFSPGYPLAVKSDQGNHQIVRGPDWTRVEGSKLWLLPGIAGDRNAPFPAASAFSNLTAQYLFELADEQDVLRKQGEPSPRFETVPLRGFVTAWTVPTLAPAAAVEAEQFNIRPFMNSFAYTVDTDGINTQVWVHRPQIGWEPSELLISTPQQHSFVGQVLVGCDAIYFQADAACHGNVSVGVQL